MKKAIAILMTLALAISAVALPVLAEESGQSADTVSSATQAQSRDGRNDRNGRQPGTPGGQNGQQFPTMPGGQQAPAQTDGTRNGQASQNIQPSRSSQLGKNGRHRQHIDLAQLLSDGVITQEVYDAIVAYLQQNALQAAAEAGTSAEITVPEESSEAPALPENTPDTQEVPEVKLLNTMLEAGIITQEQYDRTITMLSAPEAAPAL